MTKAQEPKAERVTVKLVKEHRHAGVLRQPNEFISVRPRQAKWLIEDLKVAVYAPQEG